MRMQMRRLHPADECLSKKWESHVHMVTLYTVW